MITSEAEERRMQLERLIEAVENGDVETPEDLTSDEIALLLTRSRPEESLQDLFDRLRRETRAR
jgi:hypothetical protein